MHKKDGALSVFYERYLYLCDKSRLSPSAAANNAGFNRGTVSVWKKKYEQGVDVRPEPEVIAKICSYFNCTETWLLGIGEQKEAPTPKSERDYEDERILAAIEKADPSTREAILLLLKLR